MNTDQCWYFFMKNQKVTENNIFLSICWYVTSEIKCVLISNFIGFNFFFFYKNVVEFYSKYITWFRVLITKKFDYISSMFQNFRWNNNFFYKIKIEQIICRYYSKKSWTILFQLIFFHEFKIFFSFLYKYIYICIHRIILVFFCKKYKRSIFYL